jgi:AcrR family transcriptional regulator
MQTQPVERWTPQRRRALTRDTLITSAAAVFARRGFEGASLEEIADAAGFTRGAIYKNFGGKEDLFFAVADRDFADRLRALSERLEHQQEFGPADLAALWRETVIGSTDDLALHMEVRLYALRNPAVKARLAEHQRTTRGMLAAFITEQTDAVGFELTIPAATFAGLLDAATWGIAESCAIDEGDTPLLDEFFALVVPAACTERPLDDPSTRPRPPATG